MSAPAADPQRMELRRDALMATLAGRVPFLDFLGVRLDRHGDELTLVLPFTGKLIGNPMVPALHGGATAALLEISALFELSRTLIWADLEKLPETGTEGGGDSLPPLPRTIDFSIDYLRAGQPADAYARAFVIRSGRRYASVRAEAWQESRARPFAQATVHFLMPGRRDG